MEEDHWALSPSSHALLCSGPQHLQLVRQEMAVCPEQLGEFLGSLRQYLRGTAEAQPCFQ